MITLDTFIEQLVVLRNKYGGDITVNAWPYDGQSHNYDAEIEITRDKDSKDSSIEITGYHRTEV